MSAEVLSGIASALTQAFAAQLATQWNRSAVLLRYMQVAKNGEQGNAKNVAWDVQFSGATAATFTEGADVDSSELAQDPLIPAVLDWGQYRAAFKLSNKEIAAAAVTPSGPAELGRIAMQRMGGSVTKIISKLNADAFAGNGSGALVGLDNSLVTTGSYATIDTGTYTEWKSTVLSNGGTARSLTQDLLYQLDQSIYTKSGEEFDAIVTTPAIWRKYAGLFESIRRVETMGQEQIAKLQYNSGATELFWRGKPVLRDKDATAGSMYAINFSQCETVPLILTSSDDGVQQVQTMMPSSNGVNSLPTNIHCMVYPLARLGSSQSFCAEVYVQLKFTRPNAHGILKDISET